MKKALTICIIDDDEVYQFAITRNLQAEQLAKKILQFSDGKEALNYLSANIDNIDAIPDLIFLDINMPIMDGWQFLETYVQLKPQIGKKITLYMLSSSMDPVDTKRAKQIAEVSGYIIKPITSEQLKVIVEALS
jgi:CheY-like chemotaxis protein